MNERTNRRCTAFEGAERIASGEVAEVAAATKQVMDRGEHADVLVFDDETSEIVEIDFRGTVDDVLRRLAGTPGEASAPAEAAAPRGPGRPRLGVVSREVTLLPRHWEWLNSQPGGASVTLRKLVDEARRERGAADCVRKAQDAAYRFMTTMAGDRPGYEEATRALFAKDGARFEERVSAWPADVRDHAKKLAAAVFEGCPSEK